MLNAEKMHFKLPVSPANGANRANPVAFVFPGSHTMRSISDTVMVKRTTIWTLI